MTSFTRTDAQLEWFPAVLLAGVYAVFLYAYAVNIPQVDDYSNLLKFLVDFVDAGSWSEKSSLLFSTNNTEHLTLLNRLLALAQYFLAGELNLRQLIFIGNSFTVLSFLLVISQLPEDSRQGFHLTLGALLLFQPLGWYNGTWAMAALSNLGVWPLGFAALIVANRPAPSWRRLLVAFLLGVSACLTQGNGLIALLLVPVMLACRNSDWRTYLVAAAWLLAALVLYQWLLSNDDPLVQARLQHSLKFALVAPLKAGLFHLVLVGRFFSDQVVIAAVMGLLGVAYSVLCLVDLFKGRATTCQLLILYVMGSLLLVTLLRAGMTFGDLEISHRYWFYSQLFWLCVILDGLARCDWAQRFSRLPWAQWTILSLVLLMCLSRYVTAQAGISAINRDKILGQEAWLVSGHPLSNRHLVLAEPAAEVLKRAIDRGVYVPFGNHPQFVQPRPDSACNSDDALPARGFIKIKAQPGAYLNRLTGWAQPPGGAGLPSELLLCSEDRAFRLPWLWTEYYFGPDQVDWTAGSLFNFYYLYQPIAGDIRQALLIMRSGKRFLIETRLVGQGGESGNRQQESDAAVEKDVGKSGAQVTPP